MITNPTKIALIYYFNNVMLVLCMQYQQSDAIDGSLRQWVILGDGLS